ncbi:hypothetical protein DUT93_11035 [Bacteroides xylanisolvens]|nr:hypothetical protein [Bacteroides xylanisolvens]
MPKAPFGIAARPFKMKDSFSLAAAVACCRMRETNLSLCAGGNNRFLTEQSAPELLSLSVALIIINGKFMKRNK